jgi:hypothetical protein
MTEIASRTLSILQEELAENGVNSEIFGKTGLIPVHMLKKSGEYEIPNLKIGYGEQVYIFVFGRIKLGADHSPSLASDRVQISRKIGDFTSAWVNAEENWMLASSPPDKEVQIMWRFIDEPHHDNEQVDFQFFYYIFNSLG